MAKRRPVTTSARMRTTRSPGSTTSGWGTWVVGTFSAFLDGQTLHEHAPGLGLIALDAARLGHPVDLKRHEPSIHLVEQPLPDPKDDIWSVHGVVDR